MGPRMMSATDDMATYNGAVDDGIADDGVADDGVSNKDCILGNGGTAGPTNFLDTASVVWTAMDWRPGSLPSRGNSFETYCFLEISWH